MVIAIDGYSSCGKSTLAADLASALHYLHIDSGAMYRAVTLQFLRQQVALDQPESVAACLEQIQIDFHRTGTGYHTLLKGEDVEEEIRSFAVNRMVSPVAAISAVRKFLVAQQQRLGRAGSLVMDGRDIGTVVFPHAGLKIFLTASTEVRIERRFLELYVAGIHTTREEVAQSLAYRDLIDTTREDSPLRQADDAVVIDNTFLSREEQLNIALKLAHARLSQHT
jgi:cytidylate kinase